MNTFVKWLDIFEATKNAAVGFFTDLANLVKNYENFNENLPDITANPCQCSECGWVGIVWDCEGDIDGDGNLGCPKCLKIVKVKL